MNEEKPYTIKEVYGSNSQVLEAKAYEYYEKASRLGHARSSLKMGLYHHRHNGYPQAYEFYGKAVHQGGEKYAIDAERESKDLKGKTQYGYKELMLLGADHKL